MVGRVACIEPHQRLVFGQRTHRAIGLDQIGEDGRLCVADHDNALGTGANIFNALFDVVQKRCASTDDACGSANGSEHVGVDEITWHLG